MHQEQYVPDSDRAVAIVLGELIGVELRHRARQALLDLRRDRLPLALLHRSQRVGPVDREQLGHFVGTLNDAHQRIGDQPAMRGVARHFPQHEQRRVAQLHVLARGYRERGDALGLDARHELLDAVGDGNAVLVELILPEEAVHQRALQLVGGRERLGRRAFPREYALELVERGHESLLSV